MCYNDFYMTNAILEKRVAKLEAEIRSLKSAVLPTGKRLLAAVNQAKRDIVAGRVLRGNLRELAR